MKIEIRLTNNQTIQGSICEATDMEFTDDFVKVKYNDGTIYYYAKRLVEAIYIE